MSITFKNAPLVELIAELRWAPQLSSATDQDGNRLQLPLSLLDVTEFEGFFQQFGSTIYQRGFKQMERLVPYGAPLPHDQIACRYRHDSKENPVLAQVGPSVFSVNALPPYKSWAEFRPWIDQAVSALFEAHPDLGNLKASVRYIDAFKEDFLKGRNASEFFEEELGFSLNLPKSIEGMKYGDKKALTAISTTIPLDGMQMTIKLGEGQVGGVKAGIMDTVVAVSDELASDTDAVMSAFDRAHNVIHDTFIGLTEQLSETLKPEGAD